MKKVYKLWQLSNFFYCNYFIVKFVFSRLNYATYLFYFIKYSEVNIPLSFQKLVPYMI